MNPQQQMQFNNELMKERDKHIISWNNDLREWHPIAMAALPYHSVASLQMPMNVYRRLLSTEPQGLNMNVLGILSNMLESTTPAQMNYSIERWASIMELNARVAALWNEKNGPLVQMLAKRFEIAGGSPMVPVIGGIA